jgi:hypothetical protein
MQLDASMQSYDPDCLRRVGKNKQMATKRRRNKHVTTDCINPVILHKQWTQPCPATIFHNTK